MFEREIRDAAFVKRWSIVRTQRDQSVAEHSYFVAMYANDICVFLGVSPAIHLATVQYALWHDTMEEVFTGDLPGPQKRALTAGEGMKLAWDTKLRAWASSVFVNLGARSGSLGLTYEDWKVCKAIAKTADWMDAAAEMATEVQMGNRNCERHMVTQTEKATDSVKAIAEAMGVTLELEEIPLDPNPAYAQMVRLQDCIQRHLMSCAHDDSRGPFIANAAL